MSRVEFGDDKEYYEGLLTDSAWIHFVLKENLEKIRRGNIIACLAVGLGEELLFVRQLAPSAVIHAFDISRETPHIELTTRGTASIFHQFDIQNLNAAVSVMGKSPDVVICRNPEVISDLDRDMVTGRPREINDWWAKTLTEWGKLVQGRGQMLVTTFTEDECMVIKGFMERNGLSPRYGFNTRAPVFKSFGPVISRPDSHTLRIN